jgi:hypothetical protein
MLFDQLALLDFDALLVVIGVPFLSIGVFDNADVMPICQRAVMVDDAKEIISCWH